MNSFWYGFNIMMIMIIYYVTKKIKPKLCITLWELYNQKQIKLHSLFSLSSIKFHTNMLDIHLDVSSKCLQVDCFTTHKWEWLTHNRNHLYLVFIQICHVVFYCYFYTIAFVTMINWYSIDVKYLRVFLLKYLELIYIYFRQYTIILQYIWRSIISYFL